MSAFLQLLLAGTIAQFVALFLFAQVGNTGWASAGKPVIIGALVVAMTMIVWKAVRSSGLRTLAFLCVGLALAGVAALQMLGFLVYPELVKDVDFASSENAQLAFAQATTVFIAFLSMTTLLLVFNKAFIHYKSGLAKRTLRPR